MPCIHQIMVSFAAVLSQQQEPIIVAQETGPYTILFLFAVQWHQIQHQMTTKQRDKLTRGLVSASQKHHVI